MTDRRIGEIPYVPWETFLRTWRWKQGEHVLTIGETGSGKTTLLTHLLSQRKYAVVFVTKTYDLAFTAKRWPGWHRLYEWNAREAVEHGGRVLLWPKPGDTIRETAKIQTKVFGEAFNRIYKDRGWTTVIDEVQWMVDELRLGQELRTYQHQARSSGITVVSGMQRPSGAPVITYGSASHAFISRQSEDDDVKRLAALGGVDAKDLRNILPMIPKYHWLYLGRSSGSRPILTKSPK